MHTRLGAILVLTALSSGPGLARQVEVAHSVSTISRNDVENVAGHSIVDVLNTVRANPPGFAPSLRGVNTPAGREAADFLLMSMPVGRVQWSDALASAALRHARDQSSSDVPTHRGSDGSSLRDRIQGAGVYAPLVAETMSLGQPTTLDVIRQLTVDEGVASRAHRMDLFSPNYLFAGAACAPHLKWKVICVIDFSSMPVQRETAP